MSDIAKEYLSQIAALATMVTICKGRVLSDSPDSLIINNVNYFTKSYLIMLCVYLESYIKECAYKYVLACKVAINQLKIPNNLILWSVRKNDKIKDTDLEFIDYDVHLTRDDIDDLLSANPFKTKKLLELAGIDFDSDNDLKRLVAETIHPVVAKRNDIIHHNDSASNISFDDILTWIEQFKIYIGHLDKLFCAQMLRLSSTSTSI